MNGSHNHFHHFDSYTFCAHSLLNRYFVIAPFFRPTTTRFWRANSPNKTHAALFRAKSFSNIFFDRVFSNVNSRSFRRTRVFSVFHACVYERRDLFSEFTQWPGKERFFSIWSFWENVAVVFLSVCFALRSFWMAVVRFDNECLCFFFICVN